MAKRIPWFYKFSGINNINKTTRIDTFVEGITGLEDGQNVFITSGGILETVADSVVKVFGKFHSLWGVTEKFYCVKENNVDASIYQGEVIDGEIVMRHVVSGLAKNVKMFFVDHAGVIWYSNGIDYGYIQETIPYAWPTQHNTRLPDVVSFVPGTYLTGFASRLITIVNNEIRFTEPFLPGLYHPSKNRRRLNSPGRMLRAVEHGVYVSDDKYVYFLRGINSNEWRLEQVLSYPAIAGADYAKLVEPSFFGFQSIQPALIFNTENGLCIGMADGSVYNLINKRYKTEETYNAITVIEESLIVGSSGTSGIFAQCNNETTGNKAVTKWYGGFNSLFAPGKDILVGANDSGLSLIFGQKDIDRLGLELLVDLEMITTLEMI